MKRNRILSILLVLSLSVCMMVGFGPSASAYSTSFSYIFIYPFVSYHLDDRPFFRFLDNSGSLPLSSRIEYKLGSEHDPQAFGFFIDFSNPTALGFSGYDFVNITGLNPSFIEDQSTSAYSWRTVSSSGSWNQGALANFPLYYQWISTTSSAPDFSDSGVLWDGGPIPLPDTSYPTNLSGGRLRLFIYAFRDKSHIAYPGWFGMTVGSEYRVVFSNSQSSTLLSYIYQGLASTTNPTLKAIQTSVDAIKNSLSGGSQSPMDKFESDYLTNFQNQVNKTEDYLGSSSPVLPNNFVSSSGGGSSVVDTLTDGFGLSSSVFDGSDFDSAVNQIGGQASVNEGGPWYFFTEGVMSGMETGSASSVSDDDWLEAWVSDAERRYGLWATP